MNAKTGKKFEDRKVSKDLMLEDEFSNSYFCFLSYFVFSSLSYYIIL